MKRTILSLALVGLAALSFGDITFNGEGPYFETASISGHLDGTFFSGLLNFTDSSNSTPLGSNFNTICVDLDHEINNGNAWNTNVLNSDTLGGGLQTAGNIIAKYYGGISSNAQASGLQLAAWEAVYDNGAAADFASGNFVVTNASADALTWGAFYYDNGASTPGNALYFQPVDGSQGQGQMAAVPEPATLLAVGLGLIGIVRRRSKMGARK